jgi:predicted DNA repair protein MutK
MAIALNEVAAETLVMRGTVLAVVAIAVTVAVYGAVAGIVKIDDLGLYLTEQANNAKQAFGRFLLRFVPKLLIALSVIGTLAMLWVGGGIIVHGTHEVGFHLIYDVIHGAEYGVKGATGGAGGVLGWLTYAALSGVVGLVLGGIIAFVLHKVLGVGAGEGH